MRGWPPSPGDPSEPHPSVPGWGSLGFRRGVLLFPSGRRGNRVSRPPVASSWSLGSGLLGWVTAPRIPGSQGQQLLTPSQVWPTRADVCTHMHVHRLSGRFTLPSAVPLQV